MNTKSITAQEVWELGMKESQVAGGREYMTYQITKLMLLSIYSMSYAVFGAGNMKINKLWLHPAGKTDL